MKITRTLRFTASLLLGLMGSLGYANSDLPAMPTSMNSMDQSPISIAPWNPNLGNCPQPTYPYEARQYELEGAVTLRLLVEMDGKIIKSEVDRSSGWKILDEAARSSLSSCYVIQSSKARFTAPRWKKQQYIWQLEPAKGNTIRAALLPETCQPTNQLKIASADWQGESIRLRFLVNLDGKAFGAKMENDSRDRELDRIALEWLKTCQFSPSAYEGTAVVGPLTIRLVPQAIDTPATADGISRSVVEEKSDAGARISEEFNRKMRTARATTQGMNAQPLYPNESRLEGQEGRTVDAKAETTTQSSHGGSGDGGEVKILPGIEAGMDKNINAHAEKPTKMVVTPMTRLDDYAMYYRAVQNRIEKIGTAIFPQADGKKLYGELVIYIPIFQDGTIYEKDGGPRVERSSGSEALDRAAVRIARRSAPFGVFHSRMRSPDKDDVVEIVTRFNFTREDVLVSKRVP